MKMFAIVLSLCFSVSAFSETVHFPTGKGKCPKFSVELPKGWSVKSARAKGDRWQLTNERKEKVARFDYKLSHTDQKMMPEVSESEFKIVDSKVTKYTVTDDVANSEPSKATTGLITSYSFNDGKLEGLVLMTESYDKDSGLEEKLEAVLNSLKLK